MSVPGRLLVLLGSNLRPHLHLSLALEALDRVFPVIAERGRCRAAAVAARGVYDNRLLLCRVPALLAETAVIDRYCRILEATVARPGAEGTCPIDIDPFLLLQADGRTLAFERTDKVLALLGSIDPGHRLGLPTWAWPRSRVSPRTR
ncbi:MAG TPA: hypothetical protein PKZ76_07410 [Xanthomonadaceae bacterium]|nr:hypothetical protein [Xanthomonadaceae bacterium]